jgi:hypothetical protein
VSLQDVIWTKDGRSVARGTLDSSFSLIGRGRSLAGLVSTLSGSGSFSIRDGIIRSINPTAFSSIIRAADTGLVLNPDRVRSVFEGYLDAGSLPFERASGSFGVSSGAIRVSTMSLDTKSATALGGGLLDLNTQTISSDWSLKVDPGNERVTGAEPEVGVLFSGSVGNPKRVVDVTPLMGYLTVRAFEKEVTRIEALQANIQERERLVRLLKVQREQADERIRRKAEEDAAAKRAEEEARLAAEEEARLAAEREAARIAAEKEAARLAAEEAARQAAKEEARIAAEREAARLAAEEEAAAKRQAEDILRSQADEGAGENQPFQGLDIESIIRNSEQTIDGSGSLPQGDPDVQTEHTDQADPQAADLPPLTTQTINDSKVFTEQPAAAPTRPVASARRRPPPKPEPEPEPEPEGPIYKTLPNGVTIKIR